MAIINAEKVQGAIPGQWDIIVHHYLLQGNPGAAGFDDPDYTYGSVDPYKGQKHDLKIVEVTAKRTNSFTDVFYNQIFVTPSSFDAGNVSSTIFYQVEVWNGFFVPRVLTEIDQQNSEGIFVTDGIPEGGVYGELESSLYTIEVTPDGPPTIDALIRWVFSADFGKHTITGDRLVLFPFRAAGPIVESLNYYTNIIQTHGSEQRIGLLENPRQVWDMRYKNADASIQSRISSAMWGRNFKPFGLPIWTDVYYEKNEIPVGTDTLYLDTTNFDYRDGGLVLLYTDDLTNEAREIDTVESDRINLARPTESSFPDGADILPVHICEPTGGLRRTDIGNDNIISEITFRSLEGLQRDTSAGLSYAGYEVLTLPNLQIGPINSSIIQPQTTLDSGTGPWDTYAYNTFIQETWTLNIAADNADERWDNKMFLQRTLGQLKSFWISSRRRDFVVIETIASTATQMTVENMGQEYRNNDIFHVEFILADGSYYFRQITGLISESEGGQEQIVEFNTALGVEVTVEEIERVSYLRLMRFDTDELSIEHDLGIYSSISLPIISVDQPDTVT